VSPGWNTTVWSLKAKSLPSVAESPLAAKLMEKVKKCYDGNFYHVLKYKMK
jgi:hypothetical protein